jgi:hypothetical protein
MAFLAIDVGDETLDPSFGEDSRGGVTVDATLGEFASRDVTKFFKVACGVLATVSNGHPEALVGIATHAMFNTFRHAVSSTIQGQHRASIVT